MYTLIIFNKFKYIKYKINRKMLKISLFRIHDKYTNFKFFDKNNYIIHIWIIGINNNRFINGY